MKMKNILLSAVAASTLFAFGSQSNNASANSKTTPKSYRGTWYGYFGNNTFEVLSIHSKSATFKMLNSNNTTSGASTMKVGKHGGKKHNYFLFDVKPDSYKFWSKKMKVKGKYQKVIVMYKNMGDYSVFTKQPIKHIYGYHKDADGKIVKYGK